MDEPIFELTNEKDFIKNISSFDSTCFNRTHCYIANSQTRKTFRDENYSIVNY